MKRRRELAFPVVTESEPGIHILLLCCPPPLSFVPNIAEMLAINPIHY